MLNTLPYVSFSNSSFPHFPLPNKFDIKIQHCASHWDKVNTFVYHFWKQGHSLYAAHYCLKPPRLATKYVGAKIQINEKGGEGWFKSGHKNTAAVLIGKQQLQLLCTMLHNGGKESKSCPQETCNHSTQFSHLRFFPMFSPISNK